MPPSRRVREANERRGISSHEVASMTVDHLREQLKARKLSTTGNKRTLATRLKTYLEQNATLRQQSACQREPPHQRVAAATVSCRTRSTAARHRKLSSDKPSHHHRQCCQRGPTREKSRLRSRSPISSRHVRHDDSSAGRQRDLRRHYRSEHGARKWTASASSPLGLIRELWQRLSH